MRGVPPQQRRLRPDRDGGISRFSYKRDVVQTSLFSLSINPLYTTSGSCTQGELEGAKPASNKIKCRAKPCIARRAWSEATIFVPQGGTKITTLLQAVEKAKGFFDSLKRDVAQTSLFSALSGTGRIICLVHLALENAVLYVKRSIFSHKSVPETVPACCIFPPGMVRYRRNKKTPAGAK